MADFEPTVNQKNAIEARDCSLLISAGAGSGKTKVISERILSYLTDENAPVSLDRFLVITFTKAAAAELKTRIGKTIQDKLREEPENKWLRKQSLMSQYAHIGTIHSFCQDLLKKYSHTLGIVPDFKVLDEDRASAMKYSSINKVMEERYEHIDKYPGFEDLVDNVGSGRDDGKLVELVLAAYEKIQCHAFPEDYIEKQRKQFKKDNISDISETVWGKEIIRQAKRKAKNYRDEITEILSELSTCEPVENAYGENCELAYDLLSALINADDCLKWDEYIKISTIKLPKFKAARKLSEEEKEFRDYIKGNIDKCRDKIEDLGNTFQASSKELMEDLEKLEQPMDALLSLIQDFSKEYQKCKKRAGMLDFSDLEHYAAKLLINKNGEKTEIAEEISLQYKEILIDEFQDVSSVQAVIFNAISKDEKNLFMVGDVKQSIYRFRLANPNIFLNKYKEYSDYESAEKEENKRILLKENFRSRKEVINAINHTFRTCMSEQVGDLDYDSDAELNFGASYFEGDVDVPEILVVGQGNNDPLMTEKTEAEAYAVAKKIKHLMNEGIEITDNGNKRKLEYGDIAILLRSANVDGNTFRRILSASCIPVDAGGSGGFFDSIEVTTVMSIISVIDNPRQDVPLISVLRSPVIGLNPDELSEIRAKARKSDFYDAVKKSRNDNKKCNEFLENLSELRKLAPDTELSELLWMIYDRFDIIAVFDAMNEGEVRHDNLMQLLMYAKKYGSTGYQGIHRFVNWVGNMKERGSDPEMPSKENSAVKIMSVHKSKGLEFPVVFLSCTGKQFNKQDGRESVLIHPELGLGPKVVDKKKHIEYPSFAKIAIKSRLNQENISEEMRLLYVALTRAKERLIITGTMNNAENVLKELKDNASSPMTVSKIEDARCPLYWMLYSAFSDKKGLFNVKVINEDNENEIAEDNENLNGEVSNNEELIIPPLLQYEFEEAVHLPSKVTATELKSRYADAESEKEDSCRIVKVDRWASFRNPELTKTEKSTAAQVGTATHLLLEKIDFKNVHSEEKISEKIEELVSNGYVTAEEAKKINVKSILSFIESETGENLRKAEKINREFRFSVLLPATSLFKEKVEDKVLLQGTIDCWYEENDEIVIIDYKTDRISEEELEERTEIYTVQLRAYAAAISEITGKKVKETILYYLNLEKAVKVTV